MPEATLRRVAPVPHNRLTHGRQEELAVAAVVASGQWAGGGRGEELERRLAERAGVPFAICVGSGLAALRLSLRALGVGRGSRVVVPAYSCVALANAALSLGAEPVAVDVTPGTWNLDAAAAARQQASAAVVVHTFGCRANLADYRDSAGATIEDCAHAFGLPGLGAGSDVAILSFYATKLIGAGEGGAVLTSSEEIAASVRAHRVVGLDGVHHEPAIEQHARQVCSAGADVTDLRAWAEYRIRDDLIDDGIGVAGTLQIRLGERGVIPFSLHGSFNSLQIASTRSVRA